MLHRVQSRSKSLADFLVHLTNPTYQLLLFTDLRNTQHGREMGTTYGISSLFDAVGQCLVADDRGG